MDFAFSDEQEELRAMVRRFVEERWPIAEVRRLAETPEGFDRGTWKLLAEELGLVGVAVPEACGGQGLGFLELGIALEEMGRQLAGGPFLATAVLAAQAVRNAGTAAEQARWLPALASGSEIATLATGGASLRPEPASIEATVRPDGTSWRVDGPLGLVLDAQNADWIVVAARAPGSAGPEAISLLVVRADAPGVEIRPVAGLDLVRKLAEVRLDAVPAEALGTPGAAAPALARTLDQAAIALAAESAGATARCLDAAVAYAKGRVQFGRPIASFQAVKHKAAEVMLELESARAAAYWSWWVASRDDADAGELAEAASVARSIGDDAFARAAAENLQIHGGVGFTWEFDCHLYFRRARANEGLFGDATWHRARLAERLGL